MAPSASESPKQKYEHCLMMHDVAEELYILIQRRSGRKHMARDDYLKRGPDGRSKRGATEHHKIRVGKSTKQLRTNERIDMRRQLT